VARTDWSDSGSSTGYTLVQQEVISGHMKQLETIENRGYLYFTKDGWAVPSSNPSGMRVYEDKYIFGAGRTDFSEVAVIGGPNWQKDYGGVPGWHIHDPVDITTAYIVESITNREGWISIDKTKTSKGDWHLLETKEVWGFGNTTLGKDVAWWTNTQRGAPEDRTWVEITVNFTSFDSPNPNTRNPVTTVYDYVFAKDGGEPIVGVPFCYPAYNELYGDDGEFMANWFDSEISTDEFFHYFQSVEINPKGHHKAGS